MRKVLIIPLFFFSALLCGCGSDNDNNNPTQLGGTEAVSAELLMFDEYGKQTTEFLYGEDICFRLIFHNNSDSIIKLPNLGYLLGIDLGEQNFMKVFDERGDCKGIPFKSLNLDLPGDINPHSVVVWQFYWMGMGRSNLAIILNDDNVLLPIGNYYCQFNLYLNDKDESKACRIRVDFKIRH
jgi:hypothetical protein